MIIDTSQSRNNRRGQTLIEALMALSVITMGFLGIFALLSKSFFFNRVISDQLTATYLASEGVEVAKNLIDHDVYSGAAWGNCFVGYVNGNGTADLALDNTTVDCGTLTTYASTMRLQFDPATNVYSYRTTAGSVATGFSRDVRVALASSSNEITVSGIVTWDTGPLTSRSIMLEDHFYKWR
jgi:Prokaryotic N-terminal methylation motif